MGDSSSPADRSLHPLVVVGLIVTVTAGLAVFAIPPVGLPFLNAHEVSFRLDPEVNRFAATLPATDGSIEVDIAPSSGLEVTSRGARRQEAIWIIEECASGCELVIERVDGKTASAEATLTIAYSVNDSEYVDDIELEAGN